MSDNDRLLSSVMAQEFGNGANPCACGSSANLCRVSRYLETQPCCLTCEHEAAS